jgi:hypothetical protein
MSRDDLFDLGGGNILPTKLLKFDLKKTETGKHPQREILSPSDASHDHLLVPQPSHFTPLKVEGFVVELKRARW